MAKKGSAAWHVEKGAEIRKLAEREQNLSVRAELSLIAASFDRIALLIETEEQERHAGMTAALAAKTAMTAERRQRLVARLRKIAREHRQQPAVAAGFEKLANNIEARRRQLGL